MDTRHQRQGKAQASRAFAVFPALQRFHPHRDAAAESRPAVVSDECAPRDNGIHWPSHVGRGRAQRIESGAHCNAAAAAGGNSAARRPLRLEQPARKLPGPWPGAPIRSWRHVFQWRRAGVHTANPYQPKDSLLVPGRPRCRGRGGPDNDVFSLTAGRSSRSTFAGGRYILE